MSLAVFNFLIQKIFLIYFMVTWKMHQKRKIVFFIWPSNAICSHRIAAGQDLPLLFREYEKALVQFLFDELQKLHPRMNGEHSSVLEVFSLG